MTFDRRYIAAVALHEAGHAVVALAVGATFREVSLLPTDGWDAVTCDVDAPTFRAQAVTVLGGPTAENMLGPNPDAAVHAAGDHDTIRRLLPGLLREMGCHHDWEVLTALEWQTGQIVGARQREIRALAGQLRARQVMTYADVRAFLPGAPAPELATA